MMDDIGSKITYQQTRLPSGLTLVSDHMPHVRSVALGVWVNTGSRDEGEDESGLAHLVEHLIFKGTTRRSASQIAREVDALGGQLDAFTTREMSCFYISLLDDRVDKGGELLADIFLNSSFEEKELELERGVVLEEIKMSRDNPEDLLHDLMMAHVWGGHPLARPILGSPESVSGFHREDVRRFVEKHYHVNNIVLAAAGHTSHDRLCEMASRWFRKAPTGQESDQRHRPSFKPGVVRMEKPLHQVYLDLNLPGIPQADSMRYPAHVFNTILGGSLSSRLFQKIREERGLVYSIYSGLASHLDTGLLHISASTSPGLAAQVVELIVDELKKLRLEGPGDEEIRRAKDHMIGNLALSMEGTPMRMTKLGKEFFYFDDHVTMEETMTAIEAVNRASLEEATGNFFRDKEIAFGFLGPAEGLPEEGQIPSW
jgi:predicted Zn-dependent peptidase